MNPSSQALVVIVAILVVLAPVLPACGGKALPTPSPFLLLPIMTATPVGSLTPEVSPTETSTTATLSPVVSANAHYEAGNRLAEQGHLEEAISEYDESIRLDPQYALAHATRGAAYDALGQYQRAILDFDDAIALDLDPNLALAYYSRGLAYLNFDQFEQAVQDFDESIRLDPQYADAYFNRGTAYLNLGQVGRAIQDYDDAIRLNPQDAEAYGNRGSAYGSLGQDQRAIQDYDQAIALDPGDAIAYYHRGLAYTALGDDARAEEDVDRAVELGFPRAALEAQISEIKNQC